MSHRKLQHLLAAVALMFLGSLGLSARAQQRPLLTEDVDIIPPGTMRIEAGIDFLQRARFPASGLTGDLTRVGVIGVSIASRRMLSFKLKAWRRIFSALT